MTRCSSSMVTPRRRTRRPRPRGAALLLVLIALAVGLLLVATWLDGRRESVPVARRVAASVIARHAAVSGVDLAAATIDAEDDWRAARHAGRFDEPFMLGDAWCELRVTDAASGDPPDDDTVTLRISCTAAVDDVVASAERLVGVDTSTPSVDLAFGETAILVESELRVLDQAALLPWTARPGSAAGPLVIGALDGRADAVVTEAGAVTVGTEILFVDDRSPAGSDGGWRRLPDPLPGILSPMVPGPDLDDAITSRVRLDLRASPVADVLASGVRVPADAMLTVEGDRVIRSLASIEIADGATLEITDGTLVLDAVDDLVIRGATITVADGAGLILRSGRDLRLDGATIVPHGVSPTDAATERVPTTAAADSIIATLDGTGGSITVEGRSAIVLSIIAPDGRVEIRDDAVLHGRVLAGQVDLTGRALVYALPDDGHVIGLTTPVGPHRDDEGRLVDEVISPDRGTVEGMTAAADRIGLPVVMHAVKIEPDADAIHGRGEEIRERVRRALDERRRRRSGPRWAWADEGHDE